MPRDYLTIAPDAGPNSGGYFPLDLADVDSQLSRWAVSKNRYRNIIWFMIDGC